jgi:hypothetical protein
MKKILVLILLLVAVISCSESTTIIEPCKTGPEVVPDTIPVPDVCEWAWMKQCYRCHGG